MSTAALARDILGAARARGWRIATAESCTGGLVSAALTEIPGSSDVFDRGFVTYSYPAKTAMLGVPQAMLAAEGAVSEPVARAMAEGALAASDAQLAVAVTGVAGPGASEAKPEGLVWFATAGPRGARTVRRDFGALGRAEVRARSVGVALELLLQELSAGAP
ncbi:MAG TPA: CinA family protein [Amaricoccus sp.]|uniref:CinA family protein n=1 Tax=Amaricoccus sp. TaxID=1872485 RepID=UPI002B8A82BC|nr:CinA family protein [Amaricoccus sp.]HMQ92433.1 CinA family protein [Amaricoccus sp.]HMR52933.1 CinA family protein [Amaricoccus sp.]HMT99828.1 CinA family protein [Amaricoccus sp.]